MLFRKIWNKFKTASKKEGKNLHDRNGCFIFANEKN